VKGSGRYLASGGRDKLIYIIDANTGGEIACLEGHDNWVTGVLFLKNGKHLLSISDDKSLSKHFLSFT